MCPSQQSRSSPSLLPNCNGLIRLIAYGREAMQAPGFDVPCIESPPNEPLASVTLLLPLNGSPLTLLTAGVRVFARQYRCQSSSASQHSLKSFCSSWNRHCNARMTCDSFSCVASSIRHQFKSTGSYHCLSREIESQGRAHNVRFWHLADIKPSSENVCFRG